MSINNIYQQNFKNLLIPRIRNNQTYVDLFDVISDVFNKNVYYALEQLRILRDSPSQDRATKIAMAKDLSFDYKSDLFTDKEYDCINLFVNVFNNRVKGTEDFIQFLGWVKNAKFKLIQLWANGVRDYGEFKEEGTYVYNNSKIDGTGNKQWYPTSHVNLEYDGNLSSIDESDVEYLFYKCAPIHLVLASLAACFTADVFPLALYVVKPYTNTHNVIPCIFKNIITCYLSVVSHEKSLDSTNIAQTTYTSTTYNNIISFNKNMNLQELNAMKIFDNRDCEAEYVPKYSFNEVYAGKNVARIDYYPESSSSHCIAKGLLVESKSTNYLLNSLIPATRTVQLFAGTYTASGIGTYEVYVDDILQNTFTNSSYTLTLHQQSRVKVKPIATNDSSRFQLEPLPYATSFIKTVNSAAARLPDIIYYNVNFAYNGLYVHVKYDNVKNTSCTLLYLMYDFANYIEIKRNNNVLTFNVVKNTVNVYTANGEYNDDVICYIQPNSINVNGMVYQTNSLFNVLMLNFGSKQGNNAIDGYITDIEVYGL